AVRFEYLDGEGNWVEVPNPQGLGCAADQYNDTAFDKITTTSIRMTMAPRMTENPEDPSGGTGVLEWKVMGVYASEITVPVNKELLGSSLKTASQKEEKDYTPSSWEVFKAAYDAANKVYVDTEADQAAVDQAQTALDQAMNALVYRADFTEINALIARAEEKAEEDYTAESWSVFVQALENAKQAAENLEITQEELQKAYDSLAYAMENLQPEKEPEPPKVEKGALSALIQEAERRNEEDYTAESWSEMIRILEQAKAVAEKEDASQEEVDNMTALLSTALENLEPEEKPSESETLAALKELLKKASGLTEKDYTAESWKDFAAALAEAEKIAGKEDATPEEIQAALDSLQAAIDGLQPAAGEEPAEPSEEEKLAEQLAEAVEKGNGLTRADYTPESWAVFEAAQTEAQRVLEKGSEAGAEELQTALDALNAAINQLERVDGEQSLDTSKLEELIAKAEKLQKEDYTSATWKSLSQALDEAKAILKAEGASQADIDKKAQQLENAINSLKEKGTSSADSDKTTTGSSKNDSKGGTTDTRKGVKTGDNSPVWLYSGLAGLSGVVILGLILKTARKKRNIKK
ncbi:MAG: FIVAR domain-containing protein, partial [Clostridiales bacterium]|nr:FIVAR domain-containing protein [Clostridiales bacterium]